MSGSDGGDAERAANVFADLPNPYVVHRPITNPERLVGRREEQKAIRRHLGDVASGSVKHLAFVGARGSGRTSLLLDAERVGGELKFATARLTLDEEMTSDSLSFFVTLLDALLEACAQQGVVTDSEWRAWTRHVVDRVVLPEAEEPTALGRLVASDSAAQHALVAQFVRRDFEKLTERAIKAGLVGVAVLIDEADFLAGSAALVQKLRNATQDLKAFTLIVAGTPDMFRTLGKRSLRSVGSSHAWRSAS